MRTRDQWLKLLLAAGSMGLYLLAPLERGGPWMLVVLLIPLGLYLGGGWTEEPTWSRRLKALGGALYLGLFLALAARAGLAHPGGLVMGACGLPPAVLALLGPRTS